MKFNNSDVPTVAITGRQVSGARVEISVTDNGIGVPIEDQSRIFDAFERMHGRSEFDGTGLGLAIARRVVHNHGGVIEVSSDASGGATFTLTLPSAEPRA